MKRAVGYLTSGSLVIYPQKGKEQKILFPDTVVKERKILDKDALISYLAQELDAHIEKEKDIVIVVGNGILFQHAYSPDVKDLEKRREEFQKSIPLEKGTWLEKTIETQTKTYELVTHKDYINAVASACGEVEMNVVGFIPLSLFTDDAAQESLPLAVVEEIRKSADLYEATSFDFVVNEKIDEAPPIEAFAPPQNEFVLKQKKVSSGGIFFIFALIGIIAISAIGGFFLLQSTVGNQQEKQEEVVPTATPTPTPIETVAKEDLTIQILNGTGTAGQAGTVQTLLEDADFANIETGNAEEQDHEEAIVAFSDKVGEKEQLEIMDLLEDTFVTVDKQSSEGAEFMVVITTGEEK